MPHMPQEVIAFKFSKRVNSTKKPTIVGGGGTVFTGEFRGPVDIMTPAIDIETLTNQFDYNYLVWEDTAAGLYRCYWCRRKTYFPNNTVKLQLEEDVLATFKDEINLKTFFIERSASLSSPFVTDTLPISQCGIEISSDSKSILEHFGDGWYVVGIAGSYSPLAFASSGGVYYYLCDAITAYRLVAWLNEDGATGEWADYKPIDRVISVRYFPLSFDDYKTPTQVTAAIFEHHYDDPDNPGHTVLAYYDWTGYFVSTTGVPGISNDVIYTKSFSLDYSNHVEYTADKTYLNFPPYRELTLYAGPIGKIEVPIDQLTQADAANKLYINLVFDLISGLTRIEIYLDSAKTRLAYASEDYSCTVDCAMTAQSYNKYSDILARDLRKTQNTVEAASKAAAGGASLIAGAAMQNPALAAGGVAMLASAAGTMMSGAKEYAVDSYKLSIPDVHTKGSNGSYSMLEKPWILYTISHKILYVPYGLVGHSYHMADVISASQGYTKCNGASFESDKATLEEVIAINDFLNSGFFNE